MQDCAQRRGNSPDACPQPTAHVAGLRVLADGTQEPQTYTLMVEHVVAVFVCGALWGKLPCTATDIAALVLGRLYTEGVIAKGSALPEVRVSADGRHAEVGEQVGTVSAMAQIVQPIQFTSAQIFQCMHELSAEYPLYRATHGCHSATLLHGGKVICACEDLSRHNALDKIIGRALLRGLPLAECIVYSSGRAPYDMVEKAVCAGVGGYISKAVPTQQGLALAKQAGLPIICMARNGGYTLF